MFMLYNIRDIKEEMKSSSLRLIVTITALMMLALSCTLPFYIGPAEPEEKIIYVEVTSTPVEEVAEPTDAPSSPAQTPTVSVNLDGEWTIWQGTGEQQLVIDFLQQGYSLIGNTATGDGHSLLFNGTISQDGTSATGKWESTSGTSGNFVMYLASGFTSFSGNMGGGVPLCGTRSGVTKPSPCLK